MMFTDKEEMSGPSPNATMMNEPIERDKIDLNDPENDNVISAPPDGGIKAWMQVFGAWLLVLNTMGLVLSFGAYQTYYAHEMLTTTSLSTISWVGSIQSFLLLLAGTFTGRAFDAGYFYPLAVLGTLLSTLGLMMTSLASEYWHVLLAQGLLVGLGSGCLFTPAISIVGQYFAARRALAIGIVASGSCVGGIVYPLLLNRLLSTTGFPWAVRIMACTVLGGLCIGLAVLRPRVPARKLGPLIDIGAFKDLGYAFAVAAIGLANCAFFVPFFYCESYALNIGVGNKEASDLLSVMNAVSILGRILPGALADRLGGLNIWIFCAVSSAIAMLGWIPADSTGGLYSAAVTYTLLSSGLMALPSVVIASLTPDLNKLGTMLGMAFTVTACLTLVGPPIAGALLKTRTGTSRVGQEDAFNFTGLFVFTSSVLFASGLCMGISRVDRLGFRWAKF